MVFLGRLGGDCIKDEGKQKTGASSGGIQEFKSQSRLRASGRGSSSWFFILVGFQSGRHRATCPRLLHLSRDETKGMGQKLSADETSS